MLIAGVWPVGHHHHHRSIKLTNYIIDFGFGDGCVDQSMQSKETTS